MRRTGAEASQGENSVSDGAGEMRRRQQELPEPGKGQSERQEVRLLRPVTATHP